MSSLPSSPAVTEWFLRLEAAWQRMPTDERTRQREEVQQHLEGLVAAKVAQGQPSEDAWNAALRQFGNPIRIGRKISREWGRSQTGFHADMAAIWFGLGLWALNYSLIQLLFSSPSITLYFTGNIYSHWYQATAFHVALETLFYGGGVVSYALLGRKYPFQAIKGALFTFALSALLGWIPVVAFVVRGNHVNPVHVLTAMATRTLPFMPLRLIEVAILSYLASVTKRGWYRPSLADFKIALPPRTKQISR